VSDPYRKDSFEGFCSGKRVGCNALEIMKFLNTNLFASPIRSRNEILVLRAKCRANFGGIKLPVWFLACCKAKRVGH